MKKFLLALPQCLTIVGSFAQADKASHYAEMITGDALKNIFTL